MLTYNHNICQVSQKKFNVCIHPKEFRTKDETKGAEFKIAKEICRYKKQVTISELLEEISKGKTWTPAIFKNPVLTNTIENTQECTLIALDFDYGISIDEAIEKLLRFDIEPLAVYTTLSHTEEKPKFRIILEHDQPIYSDKIFKVLTRSIFKIFNLNRKEIDEACSSINRFYYGSNNQYLRIFENVSSINVGRIYNFACLECLKDSKNGKRNLEAFMSSCEIIRNNSAFGIMYKSDEGNCATTIIEDIIPWLRNFPQENYKFTFNFETFSKNWQKKDAENCDFDALSSEKKSRKKFIGSNDETIIQEKCKLYKAFSENQYLSYDYRRLIGSFLSFYQDGLKAFKQLCINNTKCGYSRKDNNKDIERFIKRNNYAPMHCDKVNCPFLDSCTKKGKTPLSLLPAKNNNQLIKIENYKPRKQHDPNKQRIKLKNTIAKILDSTDTNIHLIKCDLGLGKSTTLLQLLEEEQNFLLAAPTHELKNQLLIDFQSMHCKKMNFTRKRPTLPEPFESACIAYYKNEDYENPMYNPFHNKNGKIKRKNILQIMKDCKKYANLTPEETSKINDYIINYYNIHNYTECFTTHSKAFITDSTNYNTIIFDEDFLSTYLIQNLDEKDQIQSLNERNLDPSKKYIILSATASIDLYKALFGKRLKFHEIAPAKTKGKIIQHTESTYSKSAINHNNKKEDFLNKIKEQTLNHDLKVIVTHKEYKEDVEKLGLDVDVLYFGNLRGINKYSGQSTGVFGIMNLPIQFFEKLADLLQIKNVTFKAHKEPIEYNGYKLYYTVYTDNKLLNKIAFDMSLSETLQASGRTRIIDHSVNSHVYTKLPIEHAEILNVITE